MATIRKIVVTRWVRPDGTRAKPHEEGAQKVREESKKWYAFGVPGSVRPIPLATNKKVAETMLARLIVSGEQELAGMTTAQRQSVSQWLDEYERVLMERGRVPRGVQNAISALRRLASDCRWETPARLTADVVRDWLTRLVREGLSHQSHNHYLNFARAFVRWLAARPRRLVAADLLDELRLLNVAVDPRHPRRALSVEEIGRVLTAALESPASFRYLSGRDRHAIYTLACTTGFRALELASMTPAHFLLDVEPPVVMLTARRGKNRRAIRQPLPPDTVALMREYLAGREPLAPLWPSWWYNQAARMLRIDLEAAGVPYTVETPDGPLYADFHALRHTYVSLLEVAGVSLRDAMQLARHSDPKLTLARYGKSQADQLGRAVASLPTFGTTEPAPVVEHDALCSLVAWLLAVAGLPVACLVAGPDLTDEGCQGQRGDVSPW